MYDATIEHSGIVDDIRCSTQGEKKYCDLQLEGTLAAVPGGDFDKVDVIGSDGTVTMNPSGSTYDTWIDGLYHCGAARVSVDDGWENLQQEDGERRLICFSSSKSDEFTDY